MTVPASFLVSRTFMIMAAAGHSEWDGFSLTQSKYLCNLKPMVKELRRNPAPGKLLSEAWEPKASAPRPAWSPRAQTAPYCRHLDNFVIPQSLLAWLYFFQDCRTWTSQKENSSEESVNSFHPKALPSFYSILTSLFPPSLPLASSQFSINSDGTLPTLRYVPKSVIGVSSPTMESNTPHFVLSRGATGNIDGASLCQVSVWTETLPKVIYKETYKVQIYF